MRPLTKKEKDIVDLAMAGGDDASLAILDKIHSIEDELTALKESIPSLKDIVGSVKGIPGDQGVKGDKGDQGPKGDSIKGDTGPQGIKGEKGDRGPKGDKGDPGMDGNDGVDGNDAVVDTEEIVLKIGEQIPVLGERIRDALELLPEGEKLSPDAIEGLQKSLEEIVSKEGARKGWGAHPLTIQQSGTTKAKNARFLNFTGAAVTQNASGVTTIAITAGGFATPTGTVNGVNTVFATTFDPEYVLADGMIRIEGFGYSYAAGSITMDIAPADFIRYA